MFNFTLVEKRRKLRLPFFNLLSVIFVLVLSPFVANASNIDGCTRTLSNTTSCSNKTYVLYLTDKNNVSYHLSGSSATYQWIEQNDGTVRIVGTGFTHSSLSGDLFTIDVLLGSPTTTAPSGSPKSNTCGSTGSTSDWTYYQTLSGTVSSRLHGIFTMSARGPAFQKGTNANITQMGYGASGWFSLTGGDGFFKTGDINAMLSSTCTNRIIDCERDVKNTVGCANTPYVLWFVNKYNSQFHLDGDTSSYRYIKYTNGDVRFIAEGLTHSSLTNDTYKLDIVFSNVTSSPPSGSPKAGNCGAVGSTSNWIYFQNTLGTITSSQHGTYVVQRQGPAFQQGMDANITQLGYGGSGWLYITGGDGFVSSGDINVMLSQTCEAPVPVCDGTTHEYDPCIKTFAKGSANTSSTTISISTPIAEIQDILVEGIYKGGQPTSGSFTNGTTSVNWTSSNAKSVTNVSGTTDKGYYQATLPAASSVTMNVGNNTSKMHGFVAHVRLKSEYCSDNYTTLSDQRYYTYHNSNTSTFSLPSTATVKNITAVLPIVEMNNDTRIATFTLTAGSKTASVTINTFDLGQSMTLQTLSLTDVPGNVTSATLTFDSPSSNGDSYISGNASLNWYMNCVNESVNKISGYAYFDRNRDTTQSTGEEGQPNVTVYLYNDANNNGILESIESLAPVDSLVTASNGYYEFDVPFGCTAKYVNQVTYSSGIDNPNNAVGAPGSTYASYTMDTDNYIVELDQTIPGGANYQIFLKTIETGAYAIISESTDGINFYHNTNIAITSSSKNGYSITASRNTKYIKFDKHAINTISGYNIYGSTTTNVNDYAIYGVEYCGGANSFIVNTKISSFPNAGSLTTDNIETASFTSGGNHDSLNNFGVNGPVFIDGYVFKDQNANGVKESGEPGQIGVKTYLYYDYNLNGIVDADENTPIDSATSASNGYYSFSRQFGCMNQYIKQVTYTSGIVNPNNLVGVPDNDAAGFTTDTDDLIVELNGTIPSGSVYQVYLSEIQNDAYAIISESTDGVNFYYNTNIAINSINSEAYNVTASRDVKYIKFDKNSINSINGLNIFGAVNTTVSDYNIHGITFCNAAQNAYAITTNLNTYPSGTAQTTDNKEDANFNSYGEEDLNNNFGFNNEGGVGNYCGSLKITIDHNKVAGSVNHNNFPVYFDITNQALKWIGDGGGMSSEYGYDIQLVNQGGARLDVEIVDYNPTTGRIKFWGNVDLLKATENTILYLRHGNVDSSATNPSSPYTWNSHYKAVYHFENTSDASSHSNNADNHGASFNTGKFGKGANLDGSSDYLIVPYSSSLDISGKKLTMSTWVRLSSNPSEDAPFAVKGPGVNQEAYMFGVDGGSNPVKVNSRVTTNNGHYRDDNGSLPVSQWALVHFVYDGNLSSGQKQVYVNGSLAYTASATGDIEQGNDDLYIGKRLYSDDRFLHAKLDELRISSNASSASWIETEYNNQNNTGSFYTVTTGTPCTDPLPVTWLTFDAQSQSESTNKLTWSTASEVNNDRFEVQRRWDNETEFTTIGKVQGAGNSTAVINYDYQDYFGTAKSQVVYYRLKQVDFDGTADYSVVRVIDLNKAVKEEIVVNVFPVPSRTNVSIQLKSTQRMSELNFDLRIMDISGKELTQEITYNKNGNYINLDVSQLPTGVYMVEISNGMQSQVIRLLVDQIKN